MFKLNNKRDVDRHVAQMSAKLSENERSSRGFAIAKSYAKVNEYELARDWIQRYIDIKSEDPAAYKFMGEIYEHLNKPDQAITSFQRSYTLNSKQNDIIKHVCRLFLHDDGWSSSPSKAKYWCDLAETENVRDDNVFSLRLKMAKSDNKKGESGGSKSVEEMILKEIAARPHDVSLRIRLVKFLLDEKRNKDAFKYCYDLEMKSMEMFLLSIDWYTTVASVLNQNVQDSWNYWCLLLTTLEKQIFLTLKKDLSLQAIKQNNIKEATKLIFELDQVLKKVSENLKELAPVKELADEFINHFRAQMSLHIATLLFQKQQIANTDQWRETTKKCLPFLLFAFQSTTVNTEAPWLKNTNDVIRNLFTHLKMEGAFRCSQAARTILACKAGKNEDLVAVNYKSWMTIDDIFNQVRETCSDLNWRKNIYRLLFANADQQSKISSSYFVQNSYFQEPKFEVISFNDVESYEDMAQYLYPSSLDHHVYLGLGRKDLSSYKCRTFGGLNLSTSNLINCNPETINRIDIDSFLYCAIIQAKRRLEAEKVSYESFNNKPNEKPIILPAANIVEGLCTEEQNDWWLSAFKIYKNISGENLAQLKATLQFGIEAVRGIDTPKVDVIILLLLGETLLNRASNCDKAEERRHLELRVEYIYKFAMKMLRHRESDSMRRIFKFATNNYDLERKIDKLTGNAIGHLSGLYFKREEYKEFVEDFNGLQNPWAHYFKADAYKKLDEAGKTPKKSRKLYAEKARENLMETLALIDGNENYDKNCPLRIQVEKDLKRLKYDLSTSFNEDLELHNTSQNGYNEEEIFHNASSSSFRGRTMPNYTEKFNDVEALVRKLSDLVISVRDDVLCTRNDITTLRDELLNIRGDITDLNVNKDAATNKAVSDIYKAIEDLSWNVTYMMNISGIPPNMRFPQAAANLQQMYNTAYPIYPMQFQQGRAPMPSQIPAHLQYNEQLGLNLSMGMGAYGTLPSPQPAPPQPQQQQLQQQQQPVAPPQQVIPAPQQIPQIPLLTQEKPVGAKSSLLEALNSPSVLNTWNSTFNQSPIMQMPPQVQPQINVAASLPQIPVVQQQQPIQNRPVEKAPPVNVVITNSDPLPAQNSVVSQPPMSVTIPPQHIKNYDQNKIQQQQQPVAEKPQEVAKVFSKPNPVTSQPTTFAQKEAVPQFGGFTGSMTIAAPSTVTPEKPKAAEKPAQPSPFANFTFGQGQNKSFTELFSNLNSKPEVTSTTTTNAANTSATREEEEIEHYEPTAHFEPVIPLPELVETKTGEEDENVLFSHRAKLLRFDVENKEWKERGIGEMKVLVQKNDPSKARLLMRREQVLKLCCNMPINKELKFTKMKETAVSFGGQDFSDPEGMTTEKLAVRFKTADLVKSFQDAVIEVQKKLTDAPQKTEVIKAKEPAKKITEKKEETKGFGDKFKPKVGSWSCDACYITNKADTLYCIACESPKDSTVPKKEAKSLLNTSVDASKFNFGMPNALGFSFGMPAAANNPQEATPKVPSPESAKVVTQTSTTPSFGLFGVSSGFSLGSQGSGFSFGSPQKEATTTTIPTSVTTTLGKPAETNDATVTSSTGFKFGESKSLLFPAPVETAKSSTPTEFGKTDFSFVFKKKSPAKSPAKSRNDSVNSEGGGEGEDNGYCEEEENQTYFTPVIPLPDKIEVKTGEENEEILYSHRSKLFRFVDKEWKERGIGDVKILKHRETGQLRMIMRRDQILKLCLNCFLTSEIEFKRKDDNSWTFGANDFSEGEFEATSFAIRFKNKEICEAFKKAVDCALSGESSVEPEKTDAELLKRLMLPDGFFNYLTKPECPGCVGCDDDKFIYKSRLNVEVAIDENAIQLYSPTKIVKTKPRRASQDKRVSFKLAEKKDNEKLKDLIGEKDALNSSFGIEKSEASTNIFAKFNADNPSPATANIFGSVFSNNTNTNSIFSSSANTTPANTATANPPQPFGSASIFGAKSSFSFGSPAAGALPTGNIFGGNKENQTSTSPANAFSNTPTFGSVFGNSANITTDTNQEKKVNKNIFATSTSSFSFAEAAKQLDKTTESESSPAIVPDFLTKTSSFGGFAEIAAAGPATQSFSANSKASPGGFFGLTVKDDFFSKNLKGQNNSSATGGDDTGGNDSENVNDDNYDPHYEPIISLPDEIQVSTGEEDEEKLFGERAKLYRYDVKTKEWKERGVGELKILFHPGKHRYRLILRREQIFKLVLNQLVTSDIHMAPMENSPKAFCWGGINYAEGSGETEQLAIRFKNEDLATKFKIALEECQEKVAVIENNLNPEND